MRWRSVLRAVGLTQGIRSLAMAALLLLGTASSGQAVELVWLEAERFDDPGGWNQDAQFLDLMGSPYLLAAGMGEPVRDAITSVTVPHSGRWRVWVRSRDWFPKDGKQDHSCLGQQSPAVKDRAGLDNCPKDHPGRFELLVAGRSAGPVFGSNGKSGWTWEDGGVHELSSRVEFRLHDLTGYYARCDCLVLAADLDWTPPSERESLASLRAECGGVSHEFQTEGPFDVVVVGGGLAGCTAAVAAARLGMQVALVQNRPLLGGNASTEILVPPVGVWPAAVATDRLNPRETGLLEEYRTIGNQRATEGVLYSDRLARFVALEPNLRLYLNTHATGVAMQSGPARRIAAVLAVDTKTGRRTRFPAKMFLDASGDSVVGVAAGAEYRQGKEPKSMYQEPWAPDAPSKDTMGNGLKYYHEDTGKPQPFTAPSWAYHFPTCESFYPGRHPRFITQINDLEPQWVIELGGTQDTFVDAEEIRDDLLRLIFGLWDHVKNHCPKCKERAATHKLRWVGYIAGKRENRRLIGDYVVTQNDIITQTLFPDRVAYGAWSVDDHYSAGFFHHGSTGQYTKDWDRACLGRPFAIPFRSLYSKNVENLLMAGRNISASHLGMSDTRVQLTCAVMGQAAGAGAALCVEHRTTPRGVLERHLGQLQQQLLKDGAHLIDLPNRDRGDLARRARAGASSERTLSGELLAAANVIDGYARAEGGKSHAWAPDKNAQGPHWIELGWNEPQQFNIVHVTFQTAALAPKSFRVEGWLDGQWKPLAQVGENHHRRHVLGLDPVVSARLRIVLDEPCGICEIRVYDEPQRLVEIARRAERNLQVPDTTPQLPWGPQAASRLAMQFDHIGIVTTQKQQGERFVPATKVWVTDFQSHPFHIEWLRFEPDTPVTGPLRTMPHVAYRVDDIRAASRGMKVLLEPFDGGPARVAFFQTEDGAVVEFMEFYKVPGKKESR